MGALFCTVPSNLNSGVSEGRNASLYNPEGGSIGEMFSFCNNRTSNGKSWLASALHTHLISDLPKGPVLADSLRSGTPHQRDFLCPGNGNSAPVQDIQETHLAVMLFNPSRIH
jgi:hypothetical protein